MTGVRPAYGTSENAGGDPAATRVLGAIFAGGRSRRFGSNKATALYKGQTLIEHAAHWLTPHVDETVLCGGMVDIAGCDRIADWPSPGLGPLGGLCAAMRHANRVGFAVVLSVACDTPELPVDAAPRLFAAGSDSYLVALPVMGLWSASHADRLERLLRLSGDRSVRAWAGLTGATGIDLGRPIANVNFREDLRNLGGGE